MFERKCGCIDFEFGPSVRCDEHPGDDDCEHVYEDGTREYPDEPGVTRLIKTCKHCGERRGRT